MTTYDPPNELGRPESGVVPFGAAKPHSARELVASIAALFVGDDRVFPVPTTPNADDEEAVRMLMRDFGDETPVWRRYRAYAQAYQATEAKRQRVASEHALRQQLERQRDEARQQDDADSFRKAVDRLDMLAGRLAVASAELEAAETESRFDATSTGGGPETHAGALWSLVRDNMGEERYQDYLHREFTDDEWDDEERLRLGQRTRAQEAELKVRAEALAQEHASLERLHEIKKRVDAFRRHLQRTPRDQWPKEF